MGLKRILKDTLSCEELGLLVRGYDLVGDIAVIIIPDELRPKETLIAEAVFSSNKRVKVVAKRAGLYGGEFRTIPLDIIGGEDRKETVHKENGVRLQVNLETVYYSPRSGNERMRVASLVVPGEKVLVMFSGIAPFPLVISRHSNVSEVVGIEKNPRAHQYGLENLKLNKKLRNISLHEGDVENVLPEIGGMYDRICMPLPKNAEMFLPLALSFLNRKGWLHFYDFQEKGNYEDSVKKVYSACAMNGRNILCHDIFECGHTAPRVQRISVDAQVE